ncbi:hypothetical protein FNV43_RR04207 [Rhamnella rubrinervis]|uniref:Uncharacterized protein n=1 Tax=Rhamnella rubrinervis TaxID=2594499 RepID=A0A8K0HJ52_9ROSA|nr:hypothetical protein FNV43_RR04207 [Rhamnella rubrinervis]
MRSSLRSASVGEARKLPEGREEAWRPRKLPRSQRLGEVRGCCRRRKMPGGRESCLTRRPGSCRRSVGSWRWSEEGRRSEEVG